MFRFVPKEEFYSNYGKFYHILRLTVDYIFIVQLCDSVHIFRNHRDLIISLPEIHYFPLWEGQTKATCENGGIGKKNPKTFV